MHPRWPETLIAEGQAPPGVPWAKRWLSANWRSRMAAHCRATGNFSGSLVPVSAPRSAARLVRLAAFQNPAVYAAQAMRRSTFGTPRIVACAELLLHHIALPCG